MRFVADSMLGRLAKWLRVLGYDTHYQHHYSPGHIARLIKDDRRLLSRHKKTANQYPDAILLHTDHVGAQITELKDEIDLTPDRSHWFSRCLICNALLKEAPPHHARENLPEYVFFQTMTAISFCRSCGRYYWPGTHRARMMKQLELWGFIENT